MVNRKTKRDICLDTIKKVKKTENIHKTHISSVISILIDELGRTIDESNKISITNFGTFELIKIKPRNIINVTNNKIQLTKETRVLRFRLSRNFKKYLIAKGKVDEKEIQYLQNYKKKK